MKSILLNEERGVTLTTVIQQNTREVPFDSERPAVLVLPGGGYCYSLTEASRPKSTS